MPHDFELASYSSVVAVEILEPDRLHPNSICALLIWTGSSLGRFLGEVGPLNHVVGGTGVSRRAAWGIASNLLLGTDA